MTTTPESLELACLDVANRPTQGQELHIPIGGDLYWPDDKALPLLLDDLQIGVAHLVRREGAGIVVRCTLFDDGPRETALALPSTEAK